MSKKGDRWSGIGITSFVFILVCSIFMAVNIWVLFKNPKLMKNWNSIGTFVFTIILLISRLVTLSYIFVHESLDNHTIVSFASVEGTTLLMTCVSFSLLIQWYETYHVL
jgi:hypothetical protein